MEIILAIFVLILAVIVFAVWVCVRLVGLVIRAVVGVVRPSPPPPALLPAGVVGCQQPRCRTANAAHARFCRRCGRALAPGAGRAAPMRYVA